MFTYVLFAAHPRNDIGLPTPTQALEIVRKFLLVEEQVVVNAQDPVLHVKGLRPYQLRIYMKTREESRAVAGNELKRYSESPVELAHIDNYWRRHAAMYPSLGNIIRCYLSGSASTGNVERLFRDATNVCTDYRSNLKPNTVSSLLLARTEIKRPALLYPGSE